MVGVVLNSVKVLITVIVSRLAILKRPAAIIARCLGYGYDIGEDDD